MVSTIRVIQAIAISSYSISHHSLSSLCSSVSTNHPSMLLWIRGTFKTIPMLFYPAQQAHLPSVSFILESLSLLFPHNWHFNFQCCHSRGIPTGQQGLSWLWAVNSWPTFSLFFSESHVHIVWLYGCTFWKSKLLIPFPATPCLLSLCGNSWWHCCDLHSAKPLMAGRG